MGVEPGRAGIIGDKEIPVNLGKIVGIRKLNRVEGVFHAGMLDFHEAGPVSFRAEKTHNLLALSVAQGEGVDPETMIKGRRDENPEKPLLFKAGKIADSTNPRHNPPSVLRSSLDHFQADVKMKGSITIDSPWIFPLTSVSAVRSFFIDPISSNLVEVPGMGVNKKLGAQAEAAEVIRSFQGRGEEIFGVEVLF